jgi:hypothetical protein
MIESTLFLMADPKPDDDCSVDRDDEAEDGWCAYTLLLLQIPRARTGNTEKV